MADFSKKASFDDVKAIKQTALALLVVMDGKEVWIPQSVIDDDSEVYKNGHHGTLVIAQWFADKNGLE